MKKTVEFFMMLTNRSIMLAKYTIGSYKKVWDLLHNDYDMRLICYLNAINKSKWGGYLDDIQRDVNNSKYPGFLLFVDGKFSNEDFEWTGTCYQVKGSDKCYPLPMVFPAEGQDEYFQKSEADYFVTVDDDFEVLNPRFVKVLLNYMDENEIPCISTDRTPSETKVSFDKYSNGETEVQRRNCTWFCIYRVADRLPVSMCVVDAFYMANGEVVVWKQLNSELTWNDYEHVFRTEKGVRRTWDNGGVLQEQMRKGKRFLSLEDLGDYKKQYIHYAAFASNSIINTPLKTAVYRFLMIQELIINSKMMKKLVRKIRKTMFSDKERQTTNRQSSMD